MGAFGKATGLHGSLRLASSHMADERSTGAYALARAGGRGGAPVAFGSSTARIAVEGGEGGGGTAWAQAREPSGSVDEDEDEDEDVGAGADGNAVGLADFTDMAVSTVRDAQAPAQPPAPQARRPFLKANRPTSAAPSPAVLARCAPCSYVHACTHHRVSRTRVRVPTPALEGMHAHVRAATTLRLPACMHAGRARGCVCRCARLPSTSAPRRGVFFSTQSHSQPCMQLRRHALCARAAADSPWFAPRLHYHERVRTQVTLPTSDHTPATCTCI